jgi:DNA (cytosine-5)-methyltransferase 1
MGLPEGWVTAVPGLSRTDQLKMLGNGCVPQQAALALEMLLPVLEEVVVRPGGLTLVS